MLKSNKGITLITLIVYVIVLMIVIALMSNFAGYFYKNANNINIEEISNEEITRFIAYLTRDTNSEEVIFIKTGNHREIGTDFEANYIVLKFRDGRQHQFLYTGSNQGIYFLERTSGGTVSKKIVLCRNVNSSVFTYDDTNKMLTLDININGENYAKTLKVNI